VTTDISGTRRATRRPVFVAAERQAELATFLAFESELLDDRNFARWAELVTDEFTYRVPTPRTPDSPFAPHWDDRTMLIEESKWSLMTQWFRRFDEDVYEMAWGENPPVRFRHLITNVRGLATADPDRFEVRSNVALVACRQSDPPKYLTGQRTDEVVRRAGELFLNSRWVVIDQVLLDFPQLRVLL
jgi:3-phenylpropionate/cinnamic acid dioxygenase small subunit